MVVFGVITDQFVTTWCMAVRFKHTFQVCRVWMKASATMCFQWVMSFSLPQNIFIGCKLQCLLTLEINDIQYKALWGILYCFDGHWNRKTQKINIFICLRKRAEEQKEEMKKKERRKGWKEETGGQTCFKNTCTWRLPHLLQMLERIKSYLDTVCVRVCVPVRNDDCCQGEAE